MDIPKNGFKSGLTTQIPTAIALLLTFILGNIQWSATVNKGLSEQTRLVEQIAVKQAEQTKLMNEMAATLAKITQNISALTATIEAMKKS
mgnify:CR=1 FL=1